VNLLKIDGFPGGSWNSQGWMYDAKRKLEYDLYYVKHAGIVFDLIILLQTVEVVLLGKGAR